MAYPWLATCCPCFAHQCNEHIARLFMRHEITTVAYGECLSACAVMFLGGSERRLSKGAVIGLHRAQSSVVDHMSFYEDMKAKRGWVDEFAYAEWNYQDGQLLAKSMMELLLEQDIDPRVLVNTFGAGPDDFWRPSLKELEDLSRHSPSGLPLDFKIA